MNGGPLPNPPQHNPVCSFDSKNKFRGEGPLAEVTPGQFKGISLFLPIPMAASCGVDVIWSLNGTHWAVATSSRLSLRSISHVTSVTIADWNECFSCLRCGVQSGAQGAAGWRRANTGGAGQVPRNRLRVRRASSCYGGEQRSQRTAALPTPACQTSVTSSQTAASVQPSGGQHLRLAWHVAEPLT